VADSDVTKCCFARQANRRTIPLMKTFSLIERLEMQFGAIAQNAFNHGNLGNPNSWVDCAASGGSRKQLLANVSRNALVGIRCPVYVLALFV